jgi:ankyrin repeat protein
MDTLPLPPRPDLAQYRKRAKELVAATQSGDGAAVNQWARSWVTALAKALGQPITPFVQDSFDRAVNALEERVRERTRIGAPLTLADAQFLMARAHSFENWAAFVKHVERVTGIDTETSDFEKAADAVVNGDLETLRALVGRDPSLVRARSDREHHVTLLHYVAANGVEDFRQKTPKNAVDIARFLLESGSVVDAPADTYGKNHWQTTMNLLVSSAHPAEAGLQGALAEVLLDFGAAVNGPNDDESPILTALDFGYGDTAETLARRGARIDNVVVAAALGRLDLVERYVVDEHRLAAGVPFVAPQWRNLHDDATAHIGLALAWACKFARGDVAHFLLDKGVNPASVDGFDMTALHWAAANGMVDLVKRLIAMRVPLEAKNRWEGTVLDSTAHFAAYIPVDGVDYAVVFKLLIDAGADVSVLAPYPAGTKAIDDVRRSHGIPIPTG